MFDCVAVDCVGSGFGLSCGVVFVLWCLWVGVVVCVVCVVFLGGGVLCLLLILCCVLFCRVCFV